MFKYIAPLCLALGVANTASADLYIDGFEWAENLAFDGNGGLFVSDSSLGQIQKIVADGDDYSATVHLDNLNSVLGIAESSDGERMYANVRTGDPGNRYMVIEFDPEQANEWTQIASLPKWGNGMDVHNASGLIYIATEGNFIPGTGEVYEVNPATGDVKVLIPNLWGADGLVIDQENDLLYVGEVISGKVYQFDLRNQEITCEFQGLQGARHMLDDFSLSTDGQSIIGTDFLAGQLVITPICEDSGIRPNVLLNGLESPTAITYGKGNGFFEGTLYFTTTGVQGDDIMDGAVQSID